MWEQIKNSEQGICPKCKSKNINYGTSELGGEGIMYPFDCKDCGFEGQEWYNLIFAGIYERTEE